MGWLDDVKQGIEDFGRAIDDHARKNGEGGHSGNGPTQGRSWGEFIRSQGPFIAIMVALGSILLGVLIWALKKVI
jgi:hypothetical protein